MHVKIKDLNINYNKHGDSDKYMILLHGWGQNTR